MASFGPACVLWHSEPGACRWAFEIVTAPGDPREDGINQTIAIPVIPGASDLAFIVTLFCAPPGEGAGFRPNLEGIHAQTGTHWTDPDGVAHTGESYSDLYSRMTIFPLAGTAGGHVDCVVGTFVLNFITGLGIVSGNGEAVAMVVDPMVTNPGNSTIATMVWDTAGVPANHTGGGIDVELDIAETLTRQTPERVGDVVELVDFTVVVNEGLVIGMAMSTSGGAFLTAGPDDGWTEIVQDTNTAGYVSTSPSYRPLPPSFGSLAIYDNSTVPVNQQLLWHNEIASPSWWTAAALLRYPGPPSRHGWAQVIG